MKFALKKNKIFLEEKIVKKWGLKIKRILFLIPDSDDYIVCEYFYFIKIKEVKFSHFTNWEDKFYYARQYFENGYNFRMGEI